MPSPLAGVYEKLSGPSLTKLDILTQPNVSTIDQATVAQPACTALQIGLIALLKDLDILPDHVIGHSSGMYVLHLSAAS